MRTLPSQHHADRPSHPRVRNRSVDPAPSPRSDVDLLVAVREGDAEAWCEIYRRYEHEARRFARSLVPSDDVDDLVAEAFAKVLRALRSGRGPEDHPERYLMVAVRTTATSVHRQRTRQRDLLVRVGPEPEHAVGADPGELGDGTLTAAFATLSPRWRQVLWWSEVEGRSPAEIGAELGLTANAAAALAYRARRALRTAYLGLADQA
jgi:RNA polymerase sigma factor (sigma-70 family)